MHVRWQGGRQTEWGVDATANVFALAVLCGTRSALTHFPYGLPRITLSQETMGPLVQWRTGGGVAELVRPYEMIDDVPDLAGAPRTLVASRGFRAYWLRGDRWSPRSRQPAPHRLLVLYVHGGGFTHGSVALYAEPLLRILGHVHKSSHGRVQADCVALEYDLAPSARFPTALLQCLRCYAHLVEVEEVDPANLVLCGDSAGGGLVLSMLLCLAKKGTPDPLVGERQWGDLPMPARAILLSPLVDVRPEHAHVFRTLRTQAHARDPRTRRTSAQRPAPSPAEGMLDFLPPEALMQYAQLYTNVLRRPRRARGPATTLRTYLPNSPPPHFLHAPVQTLAYWAGVLLDRPLLHIGRRPAPAKHVPSTLDDTWGEPILQPGPLYHNAALLGARGPAQACLATHPLVNPTLGNWADVALTHGVYVTYGEHEVLASDIRAWVDTLQAAWGRTQPLDVQVKRGPSGVHIWPFVWMYLGADEREREHGLQTVASALLAIVPEDATPTSPSSMPSDLEEETADPLAQDAWERGLARLGMPPPQVS